MCVCTCMCVCMCMCMCTCVYVFLCRRMESLLHRLTLVSAAPSLAAPVLELLSSEYWCSVVQCSTMQYSLLATFIHKTSSGVSVSGLAMLWCGRRALVGSFGLLVDTFPVLAVNINTQHEHSDCMLHFVLRSACYRAKQIHGLQGLFVNGRYASKMAVTFLRGKLSRTWQV